MKIETHNLLITISHMYTLCTAFCNYAEGFFVDNQMLINIREFQIITYLGHQLYTFLDACYIEGEFVDIV